MRYLEYGNLVICYSDGLSPCMGNMEGGYAYHKEP